MLQTNGECVPVERASSQEQHANGDIHVHVPRAGTSLVTTGLFTQVGNLAAFSKGSEKCPSVTGLLEHSINHFSGPTIRTFRTVQYCLFPLYQHNISPFCLGSYMYLYCILVLHLILLVISAFYLGGGEKTLTAHI